MCIKPRIVWSIFFDIAHISVFMIVKPSTDHHSNDIFWSGKLIFADCPVHRLTSCFEFNYGIAKKNQKHPMWVSCVYSLELSWVPLWWKVTWAWIDYQLIDIWLFWDIEKKLLENGWQSDTNWWFVCLKLIVCQFSHRKWTELVKLIFIDW